MLSTYFVFYKYKYLNECSNQFLFWPGKVDMFPTYVVTFINLMYIFKQITYIDSHTKNLYLFFVVMRAYLLYLH